MTPVSSISRIHASPLNFGCLFRFGGSQKRRESQFFASAQLKLLLYARRRSNLLLFCRHRGSLRHHAKFPLLGKVHRNRGVLRRKRILVSVAPSIKVREIGPEDKPKGGATPGRYHGIQTPLGFRENLPPSKSIIRNEAKLNSARMTVKKYFYSPPHCPCANLGEATNARKTNLEGPRPIPKPRLKQSGKEKNRARFANFSQK